MNITFTASPMSKPDDLSLKASLAWDYYKFNKDATSWCCAETGDGGIIVTDESHDLNNAFVFPDYVTLLEWLELDAADKLAYDPASYFRDCGVFPADFLSDGVVQALLDEINAKENSDAPPVSAGEKPEPSSALEADKQVFCVTFQVDGRYTVPVDASDLESAKIEAVLDFAEADFGGLETQEFHIIHVEDEDGNFLYEA